MARPAVRRIPPPRTLTIESPAELQAFRHAVSRRATLPRVRIALRLARLPAARSDAHERHINRLLASHPLVAASVTAVATAVLAAVFPLPPAGPETVLALVAWAAEATLAGALGWLMGKLLHRFSTRWRLARVCDQIAADISA